MHSLQVQKIPVHEAWTISPPNSVSQLSGAVRRTYLNPSYLSANRTLCIQNGLLSSKAFLNIVGNGSAMELWKHLGYDSMCTKASLQLAIGASKMFFIFFNGYVDMLIDVRYF